MCVCVCGTHRMTPVWSCWSDCVRPCVFVCLCISVCVLSSGWLSLQEMKHVLRQLDFFPDGNVNPALARLHGQGCQISGAHQSRVPRRPVWLRDQCAGDVHPGANASATPPLLLASPPRQIPSRHILCMIM